MLRQETVSQTETVLVVLGPLTGETLPEFERKMEALCSSKFDMITLDLSQSPAVTSAAIGKLLSFRKRLHDGSKGLRIRGCSSPLLKVFQMIKLDTLINIVP